MWQNQRIYSAVNLYRSHCTWLVKQQQQNGRFDFPRGIFPIFSPEENRGYPDKRVQISWQGEHNEKNYSSSWFFAAFYFQTFSYIFRLTDCGDFGETFEPVPTAFLANLLSARLFTRLAKCSSPLQPDCFYNWQIYELQRMIYAVVA